MTDYHSLAVDASAKLFCSALSSRELPTFRIEKEQGADVKIFTNQELFGIGEVKTLITEKRAELFAELFRKKKSRSPLPKGSGTWGVQLEESARVNKGLREIRTHFSTPDATAVEQIVELALRLEKHGFRNLTRYPNSVGDSIVLTAPVTPFTPIENGIDADVLIRFFEQKLADKEAVREVQESSAKHRHLFLWPWDIEFPAEYYASDDYPLVLPARLKRMPAGFTGFWVGHPLSLNWDRPRGWFCTAQSDWTLVEGIVEVTGKTSNGEFA